MTQRKVLPEKLTVPQQLIQFPVLYRTRQLITISTTASLTPAHLIPSAYPPSVLTYILHCTISLLQPTCLVHFKSNADMPKWGTKKLKHWQIMESLT